MKSQPKVIALKTAFQLSDMPGQDAAHLDRSNNLHDAAYEQMRQALINGRFKPGQTFTIRTLAAVFGTSPMPVRDALKRLVAERVLELRPNRSVAVPFMSRSRFQEILQIRLALEPMLVARAVPCLSAEQIGVMAHQHEQMCEAEKRQDPAAYLAANRRFHFQIYEAARTVVMMPIVEALWMQIGPYLREVFGAQKAATRTAEHHHIGILRALRRYDPEAAARGVWSDISDAADEILAGNLFSDR